MLEVRGTKLPWPIPVSSIVTGMYVILFSYGTISLEPSWLLKQLQFVESLSGIPIDTLVMQLLVGIIGVNIILVSLFFISSFILFFFDSVVGVIMSFAPTDASKLQKAKEKRKQHILKLIVQLPVLLLLVVL